MNWDDLKIVLAVHRGGSLTDAARRLDIDASTATRRLAAIERDLGTILFARSKTGLRANEAGKIVIDQAIEIEQRTERLLDRMPHRHGVPTGSVRLLSNPWLLTQIASHGLAPLRRDYPAVELVMIADTRRRSIAAGETDLSLFFEQAPNDGEFAIPLCDVPYALFAPAGVDPDTVDWMTVWNVRERIEPMRWISRVAPAVQHTALKTNDPPALLGAIVAGLGKALIPVCMGMRESRVAQVAGFPIAMRRLHLHAHPDLVQLPRVQATMAWLHAVVMSVLAGEKIDARR